ncbi:MAG: response regulator [Clostridiales bacterium]|nr:response regulator [Clostridiales bacterium]
MKILIVDDEMLALNALYDTVKEVCPDSDVHCFDNCDAAVKSADSIAYDVCFLDIAMPGRNGLVLSRDLKNKLPGTNIVFVTGYSEYAVDAFSLNASGYILKPARALDVKNALDNLRNPVKYDSAKLRVQCFGNFEVFCGDEAVRFGRSKAKELFAYLIDLRGASANTNEICAVLFETDSTANKHYLRNVIAELKNTLIKCNAGDVLICSRNSYAVDVKKVECDYYKYLEYDVAAINSYHGEYMRQYDWAEMTNGFLTFDSRSGRAGKKD